MGHPSHVSRAIDEIASQMAVDPQPETLVAIMWKYDLSDDEFSAACNEALLIRRKQSEMREAEIQAGRTRLIEKAAHWGRKQAEIEVLHKPLPWSRDYFVELADRAADHYIAMSAGGAEPGDEYAMQLIVDMAGTARNALIYRVGELMKTSSPEAKS